ncbi:MAG: mannose-1-phosphate guanylyltransferase [Prevotellaceae bacterium]|nr:mannose-1-phosphate guanylyltransferase [Candidatus Minthosoma caballi]
MERKNYCIILAGGIGSRLWPLSRESKPKQFIDVLGTGKTLLQMTYERFASFIDAENIIIVTNENYRSLVMDQIPGLRYENMLMEPMRRNTVPAVTWAAMEVKRRCPDGRFIVSPSDQNITGLEQFQTDVLRGLEYVGEHNALLTLGAKPSRAEISYGYIQMAEEVDSDIFKVQSFTEKPANEFAKLFYESGEFLWNTGLFIWSADTFLSAVADANPAFSGIVDAVRCRYDNGFDASEQLMELFCKCPNLSLEESVLEKSDNVDVMLCHFGWADLGAWEAVHDVLPKLEGGNVVIDSKSLLYDCKDCLIKLPDGHVAVVQGLENYVVVEDGNVLVICKKDGQKNIRKFVNDARMNLGEEFV